MISYIWVTDELFMDLWLAYRWVIDVSHMGHTLLHMGLRWITDEFQDGL